MCDKCGCGVKGDDHGNDRNHDHAAEALPDFRDGVAVAQIVDAMRRASDEHQWVNVG